MISAVDDISHTFATSLCYSDCIKVTNLHRKMILLSNISQCLSTNSDRSCEQVCMLERMTNLSSCNDLTVSYLEFVFLVMSLECLQLPNSKNNTSDRRSSNFSPIPPSLKCVRDLETHCIQMLLSKEELLQTLQSIQNTHPLVHVCRNKHSKVKIVVAHTGDHDDEVHTASVSLLVPSKVGFQGYLANNLNSSLVSEIACTETQECLNAGAESKILSPTRIPAYDFDGHAIKGSESVDTFFFTDGVIARSQMYTIVEGNQSIIASLVDDQTTISSSLQWKECAFEFDSTSSANFDTMFPLSPNLLSGQLHASINEDVFLSLSCFGPQANGKIPHLPRNPKAIEKLSERTSESLGQPSSSPQKLSKKQQEQHALEQQRLLEEERSKQKQVADQQYRAVCKRIALNSKEQQLFLTSKKGLHVNFQILRDFEYSSAAVAVHQEYLCCKQMHLTEGCHQEKHRCYLPNGTIICFMKSGSIIIRCSNGTIFETASNFYEDMFNQQVKNSVNKDFREETIISQAKHSTFSPFTSKSVWLVTTPHGKQYLWKRECDSNEEDDPSSMLQAKTTSSKSGTLLLEPLKVFRTTDPASQEVCSNN